MNSSTTMMFSQLTVMLFPTLTYLAGIVLALIWWRRWPQCCALITSGLLVLLLTSVLQPLLTQYIVMNRGPSSIGSQLLTISIITSFIRAIGTGLLIWGAFAGRTAPVAELRAFEPLPPRVQSMK